MPTKRQPVQALNLSREAINKAAKAEALRKTASKKTLIARTKRAAKAEQPAPAPAPEVHVPRETEEQKLEAYKAALRIDAKALDRDPEEYIAEQLAENATARTPYHGPMVILKTARLKYSKAANGVVCNGDKLASICGQYLPTIVVKTLWTLLGYDANPYSHLNVGQQSMNLRNRARKFISDGKMNLNQLEQAFIKNTNAE